MIKRTKAAAKKNWKTKMNIRHNKTEIEEKQIPMINKKQERAKKQEKIEDNKKQSAIKNKKQKNQRDKIGVDKKKTNII